MSSNAYMNRHVWSVCKLISTKITKMICAYEIELQLTCVVAGSNAVFSKMSQASKMKNQAEALTGLLTKTDLLNMVILKRAPVLCMK